MALLHTSIEPANMKNGRSITPGSSPKIPRLYRGCKKHDMQWHKNWFDSRDELPTMHLKQKQSIIASLITKLDSDRTKSHCQRLLYALRIRALIALFFCLDNNRIEWPSKCIEFLTRDLSTHPGWKNRTFQEDEIISGFQLAYAKYIGVADELERSGDVEKYDEGDSFSDADKLFGALRHANYVASISS